MKKTLLSLILICLTGFLYAQKDADWKKDFSSKINWYTISDAGTLLVGTKDALYGLGPDGKEIWKADDIENIREENMDPIESTPYINLIKIKMNNGYNKVIDVVSGKTVMNSEDMGMAFVSKRFYLPESNRMLVYGPKKGSLAKFITGVADLGTGKVLWTQEKFLDKKEELVSKALQVDGGVMIATNKRILKLNDSNGEVAYSIEMKNVLPVIAEPMYSYNGKGASQAQTASSAEFFQTEDKSKFYFWNKDILTQFDVATGKETWKRFELPAPITYILHDSRGMLIMTDASYSKKAKGSLILLDPKTGNTKWEGDGGTTLKGNVLAHKMAGSKLILATQVGPGDNYISIIDLDNGKSVTKKPIGIKGAVMDLQLVPQGIYFRTGEEINIMDLETAAKTWKKGFKVKNCVGYNIDENTGYVYGNGKVYKVDFKQGELDELIPSVDFRKGEEPTALTLYNGNLLLNSDQQIKMFSSDGKVIYDTYVEAPGRSLGGKLLSGLGGVAAMAASAGAMAQSAQLNYAKGYYGSTSPSLDRSIKNANQMASSGAAAGVASFQSISKRFSATAQANNFVAMLAKFGSNKGSDAGITIVSKEDGKKIADLLLGDKKDPDYKLDELGRIVYYRSAETIEGFKF
ncbi:MAG: PQQ-binding-like beta-propeller repeat protein [Chitinophagaceae bacterium]|nr:PQQ-binding-like beta-propeller repeat protein [Chitinophagaceae bacterium]